MANEKKTERKPKAATQAKDTNVVPAATKTEKPITVVLIGKPGPKNQASADLWNKHFKASFQMLHLEEANCDTIKELISAGTVGEKFILAYDSALAVNDFGMAEIQFPKQMADGSRNTGLPVLLYSAKSEELLAGLDGLLPVSALIEQYFRGCRIPALTLSLVTDNLKCGVYRSNPRMEIVQNAFKNKIWLHVVGDGWTPVIAKMLSDHLHDA